jgi:hypothetical protein
MGIPGIIEYLYEHYSDVFQRVAQVSEDHALSCKLK